MSLAAATYSCAIVEEVVEDVCGALERHNAEINSNEPWKADHVQDAKPFQVCVCVRKVLENQLFKYTLIGLL